ncbi:MAG: carbohydrate ABC transporter permease [Geminicoccaceae bacterium]
MFPTPIEKTSAPTRIGYRIALPVALVVWLLPLIAVMLTSIRSLDDINQGNYWGWPNEIAFVENYLSVFGAGPMGRYLLNSLVITIPTVIGTIAISTLAGMALSLYRYRMAIPLFAMFIAGNFIPFQILMIPVRDLMVSLGMYDTYGSLILFHIAFQSGFCTLFMRNFIKALPFELIESARVLGVSEFGIFWKVVVPLVRPAMAALAVLIFTFIWNDYFWALVLVQSDEVRPITVGLNALKGQWVASWQLISAGSVIAALPPVVMFFAMQKHFIAGLTLGATKG